MDGLVNESLVIQTQISNLVRTFLEYSSSDTLNLSNVLFNTKLIQSHEHAHYTINVITVYQLTCNMQVYLKKTNPIGGVMDSMLASSAVDRGFELRSCQTKDYEIGICCVFAKHAALRRQSKNCLVRNQDNMLEWGDMSIRGLLFQ